VIELVTADKIEVISVSGAEEARARAEKTKTDAKHAEDVSFTDSAAQLAKELARIKAVRRHRKIKNID
jgi:hypothetical protein